MDRAEPTDCDPTFRYLGMCMSDPIARDDSCLLCGATRTTEEVPYVDSTWTDSQLFEGLAVRYCQDCGFGFSAPDLNRSDVDRFYLKFYRGEDSPYHIDFRRLTRPVFFHEHSLAQLLLAQPFGTFQTDDLYLDVGAGSGASFSSACLLMDEPRLCALEHNEGSRDAYRRLYGATTAEDLDGVVGNLGKAKLVLSSHCLEHFRLPDLVLFLTKLKNCIAPGGVFVAEVPHVDLRRHVDVRAADAPHFLFFSAQSLRMVLEQSGFEVLFLESCGPSYSDVTQAVPAEGSAAATPSRVSLRRLAASVRGRAPWWLRNQLVGAASHLAVGRVDFSSAIFSYGGKDRSWLRVVAR